MRTNVSRSLATALLVAATVVVGFPGSLSVEYAIEERNEEAGLVLRMSGVGVNALNDDLGPTRTYLDRIGYQSGI